MTSSELAHAIISTRNDLSEAMRRRPDNIYRRMNPAAQNAWDDLDLPKAVLTMLPRQIVRVVEQKMARMTAGGAK